MSELITVHNCSTKRFRQSPLLSSRQSSKPTGCYHLCPQSCCHFSQLWRHLMQKWGP